MPRVASLAEDRRRIVDPRMGARLGEACDRIPVVWRPPGVFWWFGKAGSVSFAGREIWSGVWVWVLAEGRVIGGLAGLVKMQVRGRGNGE